MSIQHVETPTQRPGRRAIWLGVALILLLLTTVAVYVSIGRVTAMSATNSQAQDHGSGAAPGDILATITNSGSTNTQGFTLTIYNDGSGTLAYTQRGRQNTSNQDKKFSASTFDSQQLATLLKEVGDVSSLPRGSCLKSASFGTSTTITYNGKTSTDLSCPSAKDTSTYKSLRHLALQMANSAHKR